MGDVPDLTVEILKQIRATVEQTRLEVAETRKELGARIEGVREELGARIEGVREELGARIDGNSERLDLHERLLARVADDAVVHSKTLVRLIGEVEAMNGRIDNFLLGSPGRTVRDHETRIGALETDVAALKRRAG